MLSPESAMVGYAVHLLMLLLLLVLWLIWPGWFDTLSAWLDRRAERRRNERAIREYNRLKHLR